MFGFLSVVVICATFIWFANRYIQPYVKPEEQKLDEVDPNAEQNVVNLDAVIQELWDRVDNEEN